MQCWGNMHMSCGTTLPGLKMITCLYRMNTVTVSSCRDCFSLHSITELWEQDVAPW